jgi:hypothetical protein
MGNMILVFLLILVGTFFMCLAYLLFRLPPEKFKQKGNKDEQ